MKKTRDSILKNPLAIIAAILVAILLGVLGGKGDITVPTGERDIFDWIGTILALCAPLGDMFLNMLRMTIYPILIAAIVSSIAGLVKSPEIGKFLSRMLFYFGLMLLVAAVLGTFTGLIGRPGAGLSEEAKATLSQSIEKSEYKADIEITLSEQEQASKKNTLIDFFANIVPRNIFVSLVDELALQLVIFSIVFGIAAGIIKGERSEFIITVFEGLFRAFQAIISWLMYLLPFGLIFLIAGQITTNQKFFEVLSAMIRFIVLFYIAGIALLIINTIIIWKRSKEKLGLVLRGQLDPIIIALATRSSFATLPSAIRALDQKLGFFENTTKLYIPLGITLGRYGNILYFALAAMFVGQLYDTPVTIGGIFVVLIGSIFAGTATAGATGLATLGLLGIVLEPLGLPLDAVLILFMTIDTIIDPLRTLLTVHSNMAVNALVAGKASRVDRRNSLRDDTGSFTEATPIDLIQRKGEIVVAISNDDIPLFHVKTAENDYSGIEIDLAKSLANEFDVTLRIDDSAETEEDLIEKIIDKKADFAVSRLKATPNIKSNASVTIPYLSVNRALLGNKNFISHDEIRSLSSHRGTVGVYRENGLIRGAEILFPESERKVFANYDEMVNALVSCEVELVYGSQLDLRYSMKKLDIVKQKQLRIVTFRKSIDSYIIALSSDFHAFTYIFNKVIQDLNIQREFENLVANYRMNP